MPHEFKNYDTLMFNQKDFLLRTKPSPIDNPHNLSAFDTKLKATFEREQAKLARENEATAMAGKQAWVRSFKVPERYYPINQELKSVQGKKEASQFLQKE